MRSREISRAELIRIRKESPYETHVTSQMTELQRLLSSMGGQWGTANLWLSLVHFPLAVYSSKMEVWPDYLTLPEERINSWESQAKSFPHRSPLYPMSPAGGPTSENVSFKLEWRSPTISIVIHCAADIPAWSWFYDSDEKRR